MNGEVVNSSPNMEQLRVDATNSVGECIRAIPPVDELENWIPDEHLEAEYDKLHEYFIHEAYRTDDSPELARERILKAFNEARQKKYPHKDLETLTSLSKAVDSCGLDKKLLHSLSPGDEINLLRAAAYAGMSRHTKPGTKLNKEAKRILKYRAHNSLVHNGRVVIDMAKEENEVKMLDTMHRSWLTAHRLTELEILELQHIPDTAPIVSIDTVFPILAKWRYIGEEPSLEDELRQASGIEELDLRDEVEDPIRAIPENNLSHRLTNIAEIENNLFETFGTDIKIQYKELGISQDKTTRELYTPKQNQTLNSEELKGIESVEGSSDFSEYVFIEITKADGEVYVIADSPDQNNACYVVRGDIMREMSALIGKEITWEDTLKYPKETARQLGAARLYHTSKDTLEKAVAKIESSPAAILKTIAERWLTSSQSVFDANMNPTEFNRLPRAVRDTIAKRSEETKEILLAWLDREEIPNPRSVNNLGSQAVKETLYPSSYTAEELQQAELENTQKDAEIKKLRDENAKLWAMLEIALNRKSAE